MKALLTIAFLLFPIHLFAQSKIQLVGPEDAKRDDLEKAAAAMQGRCSLYGYKDIVASVTKENVVELRCPTLFTDDMKNALDRLSKLKGLRVEIRSTFAMTDVEQEQYKPGNNTCPPGSRWFNEVGYGKDDMLRNRVLMREYPVISKSDFSSTFKEIPREITGKAKDCSIWIGTLGKGFELNKSAIEKAKKVKHRAGEMYSLLIDDEVVNSGRVFFVKDYNDNNETIAAFLAFTDDERIIPAVIKYPMPLSLEAKE